jgi:proline iminopeptidase
MRKLVAAGFLLVAAVLGNSAVSATGTAPAVEHAPGRMLPVNGTRLWVEEEGAGPPLVVLVGGPGASHVAMHPAFSALSDKFKIIYYDYRGRGRSDPSTEVTFNLDVEDLDALRVSLGHERIAIYGFSYGGLIAQGYALAHPERVSHLILANTLYSGQMWGLNHQNINRELQNQFPEIWSQIEALRERGVHSSADEMQKLFSLHSPLIRWYNPDHASRLRREAGSFNKELYSRFVGDDIDFENGGEVAKLPDFGPRLQQLRMPVLILAGRYDRALYPKLQLAFKGYCPQAKFVMLEHSGSYGHVEEPDVVVPLLREFLTARD